MSDMNATGAGGFIRPGTGVTVSQFNQWQEDAYNAGVSAGKSSLNDSSNLSDPTNYLASAKDLAEYNTQSSQELAREQMRWQEEQNAKAMDFNATEAQKTRDWQTMMSNTAHQREVADLIAAGLNPVLSVNQNGASVGSAANASGVTSSGAKGTVDTSAVNAMVAMYQKAADMAMQQNSLAMEQKKIDANVLMNALTNDTNRYMATKSADATVSAAGLNSSAHRYAAELDYSTWSQGLHNQYAQLGEWIFKALSGLDFSSIFDFNFGNLFDREPTRTQGYHEGPRNDTPRETDYGTQNGRTQRHYLEMHGGV